MTEKLGSNVELWNAVKTRDPHYHSSFVYGVNSTKIYCRPTCASRKPKSAKLVAFFLNSTSAREAGFRPCARCKPDDAGQEASQTLVIQRLCEYITENFQQSLTLAKLSSESGLSPFHLQRIFKRVTGVTPREYAEAVRLGRLKMSLRSGDSVRRSTYGAGYKTTGWLYFRPNEKLGMSPSKYRSGGEGLEIDYAITDCPLGKLLVAATERGVCFVSLDDSSQKLLSFLRSEYPKAKFRFSSGSENSKLSVALEKIMEYLTEGTDLENSSLPLDLQATAFQSRVWKELRAIPYGSVKSYSEIAERIGLPKATRAVANACAANPVPLVVPCHRVVPKNGGFGGYGLGVERKKLLLEKEGVDLSALKSKKVK
ncbi:MAG: methylated-DNA--[protein]-cysteine S-methyltransferase [Nitrososphaerota archaeon]|nr:methylated-DNA--[protein]-cysteine S-methyltransferase [Nitrososphaerota archaeon]